ncbi:MAG: RNA 2',3'-cyclic phosphodiesterase [Nanoarchaeota archaeon]
MTKPDIENKKLTRCFIALELSREAIDKIEEIQKLIKKKNLFYGKFTEPENLHLTLKFLGEIEENKIEEIKKVLAKIKFGEFEVKLGEIGVFINKYNSILWLKLNGPEIWNLQKEIDNELKGILPLEEKFMSHITIARMKKISNKIEFLDYIKNIKVEKIKFSVKQFTLKKSELKSEGPSYENLKTFDSD